MINLMGQCSFRVIRNIPDGGYRAICTCGWSAQDEDKEALQKRASIHEPFHPAIPEKVPFKSGLKEDLWS